VAEVHHVAASGLDIIWPAASIPAGHDSGAYRWPAASWRRSSDSSRAWRSCSFELPGVGPVHAGSGDAVERGDSMAGAAAGCVASTVGDGDPGVGRARWLAGPGEGAGESGVRHVRSPGC